MCHVFLFEPEKHAVFVLFPSSTWENRNLNSNRCVCGLWPQDGSLMHLSVLQSATAVLLSLSRLMPPLQIKGPGSEPVNFWEESWEVETDGFRRFSTFCAKLITRTCTMTWQGAHLVVTSKVTNLTGAHTHHWNVILSCESRVAAAVVSLWV